MKGFKMADKDGEKCVESTSEIQQSASISNENDSEHGTSKITEGECPHSDSKKLNATEKDSTENTDIRCSSSDEIPGFLRSFTEKKQSCRTSDYLENDRDKIESPCEQSQDTTAKEPSLCQWQDCSVFIGSRSELSQHVHQSHVEPMTVQDVFVCLWKGCKVFNKPSCSHSWLSKHMNSHTGDKAFKCMIDGCTMSFSSCEGLSRHVAAHFNEPKPTKRPRGDPKDSPKKLPKKRKVKVVRRRKPSEVKEDFVNPNTVATLKKRLPSMMSLCYEIGIDGTNIILHSKVHGKRINDKSGETDLLLHWTPGELIPDEWIPLDDYDKNKTRVVHISSLPNHVVAELDPAFYRCMSYRSHTRK